MKILSSLLKNVSVLESSGALDVEVKGLAFDSREVKPGFAFFAVKGSKVDGHVFIDKALNAGASVIVCEILPEELYLSTTYILVKSSSVAIGYAAAEFYDNPSQKLQLVGVTGTNGKTTIATLLYRLMMKLGHKAGLISTISYKVVDEDFDATHTTPDQLQLQRLMKLMVDKGCEYCFMEVSSHSVDQQRIAGLQFKGALFTNITHDHLDYHITFDNYLKAKKLFFDGLNDKAFALTNIDDKNGMVMLQNTKAVKKSYSLRSMSDFKCKILESHFDGTLIEISGSEVWTHFVGKFNSYNLLAVYGAAIMLGFEKEEVLIAMSELLPVDGRFEILRSVDGIYAIVDYAHTPDALENVLSTISEMREGDAQIICVAGAGGDRDKTKRPEMAAVACNYSDKVILTSDNPRTEVPEAIIADMEAGVEMVHKRKVVSIVDRKEAIKTAIIMARPGDIILVAGKGHETYQDVNGVKHHFDDREVVKEFFGL